MQRRQFLTTLSVGSAAGFAQKNGFAPDWDSLRRHPLPDWFQDAKLGIFVHWGLYSVPAWAPTSGELGKVDWSKWFYQNAYAEWYLNTIRLKDTPSYQHHVKTYGADYDYYNFADAFNKDTARWQPQAWAELFKDTGARYVVLTSKHHDGFTLWPSQVQNPKTPGKRLAAKQDLVGDLTSAVRKAGLKMGLYYSGGLDWTFETKPIATMQEVRGTIPQTPEYARYVDAHWRELMARYQPSILWNDIGYPKLAEPARLFADFYNKVPDGLINNRFSVDVFDFTTPEYAKHEKIVEKKWESCRGLGFSFGYNQAEGPEHALAPDKLIAYLVDIVSANGNLLLNVGPKPDGSISELQLTRLKALGAWLRVNGDAIFGSRTWVQPSAGDIRFTTKGDSLFAFFPAGAKQVVIPSVKASSEMKALLLGAKQPVAFKQNGANLELTVPDRLPSEHMRTLQLTPAPSKT